MTFSARTTEGEQTYACDEGVWVKVGSSAKLENSRGGKLGFFQSAYECKKRHSNMRWTLYNSAGDQAESGFATSSISGTAHILLSPLLQIAVAPKPYTRLLRCSERWPNRFRSDISFKTSWPASMCRRLSDRFRNLCRSIAVLEVWCLDLLRCGECRAIGK